MNIYFNKGTNKERVIRDEDILKMSKQELKTLKSRIQNEITEVALKRDVFKIENNLPKNSPEFLKKMHGYKSIISKYMKAISWIGRIETEATDTKTVNKEHWLWCFYQEVLNILPKRKIKKLIELTDERAKFHLEVEKWEYKE